MSYTSKYTGQEIDSLLDKITSAGGVITPLYNGEVILETNTPVTLADDITKYDIVIVEGGQKSRNNTTSLTIINPEIGLQYAMDFWWKTSNYYVVCFKFDTTTTITLANNDVGTNWVNTQAGISKVWGIKLVGASSEALTELPIASAETLGGVKVGEGLEITEDGILSALGSKGKVTLLAESNEFVSFTTGNGGQNINKDYALNDSIENYDVIAIEWGSSATDSLVPYFCLTDAIKKDNYEMKYIALGGLAFDNRLLEMHFKFTSTNVLTLAYVRSMAITSVVIKKVYGIKLGGGSSYREQELLSTPKEYTITGGRAWTALNTTITLNDSISNYDALEFTMDIQKSNGYYHTRHYHFSVSNIIYNNSNDTVYDGSHMLVPFGNMTYSCVLGGWFKTDTVFYLVNIGVWNLAADNIEFPTARLRSIKGIKY